MSPKGDHTPTLAHSLRILPWICFSGFVHIHLIYHVIVLGGLWRKWGVRKQACNNTGMFIFSFSFLHFSATLLVQHTLIHTLCCSTLSFWSQASLWKNIKDTSKLLVSRHKWDSSHVTYCFYLSPLCPQLTLDNAPTATHCNAFFFVAGVPGSEKLPHKFRLT